MTVGYSLYFSIFCFRDNQSPNHICTRDHKKNLILQPYKKREINTTSFTVRKCINSLRYDPEKRDAAAFIEKFEDLVRNYENPDVKT